MIGINPILSYLKIKIHVKNVNVTYINIYIIMKGFKTTPMYIKSNIEIKNNLTIKLLYFD